MTHEIIEGNRVKTADSRPAEDRAFWRMIAQASNKGWRLDKDEARVLVEAGIGLGFIDAKRGPKLARELEYGGVMLREDGQWACSTCGGNCGNCGQCGMTDFYGNIGFSMDHMVKTEAGRHSLPRYALKSVRRFAMVRKIVFVLAFIFVVVLVLSGCTTTHPPPCLACVGPYDITLSSHREALGLTP